MTKLFKARNIGKEMSHKLFSVGIDSLEKLKEMGSKEAFLLLKNEYSNICLVHLYVLEGAIRDIDYNKLSEETKKDLKMFSDSNKSL